MLPGDPANVSGGFLYDRRIIDALRDRGWVVNEHALPDGFPAPSPEARAAAANLLGSLPDGEVVVIDGLALGVLPEEARQYANRLTLIALIHHPLALETGLEESARDRLFASERQALTAVAGVITTSARTARDLGDYDIAASSIRVIEPGVDPAPLAAGSGEAAPVLLTVASLTPRKGHAVLLRALAPLADLDWYLICVGSQDRDPSCAESLRQLCDDLHLSERVTWSGEVDAETLEALYHRADLFVLASHHEGYGMVLTEALMRGLPIVATRAGAIPETLPTDAACLVPPNDPSALSHSLEPLIAEPARRAELAAAAREARDALPSWQSAGDKFAAALESFAP